jgi:hypothetical protein
VCPVVVVRPGQVLTLCLVYELSRGPASHWAPYFNTLPHQDNLASWTPEELLALQDRCRVCVCVCVCVCVPLAGKQTLLFQ